MAYVIKNPLEMLLDKGFSGLIIDSNSRFIPELAAEVFAAI